MAWLHEHGLVSCWADRDTLPAGVLQDAYALMYAESVSRQVEEQKRRR